MKPTILCVDDEIDNVEALERTFRRSYTVLTATSGIKALKLLEKHEVAVIISDQRMPQMKGVEFLQKSILSHPDTIRILLTGYSDMGSVVDAINTGEVYRYITKPWNIHDLQATVARAVERYQMKKELQQKTKALGTAYKKLQQLDEAKSQFMLLIHHELKTPLTTISSFLQLLTQSDLNQDQSLYCKKIQEGTHRLNELIVSVLEIMEVETGHVQPHFTQTLLKPLIEDLTTQVAPLAHKKEQTFDLHIPEVFIYADKIMLEKALKKLLQNAIAFGDSKTTVIVQAILKENQMVEISVVNQGPTLSQSIIDQILQPFVLNEDSMHHSKGLGLGLKFCQALLKCHNCQLQISSQNHTVKASFTLPIYVSQNAVNTQKNMSQ